MTSTVRFSKIIEIAGKPNVHLLWLDPAKDRLLQKAITANRIMTVVQGTVGNKTDYGIVGFQKNVSGQILIFPKPLTQFTGKRVIGVKYDLLEWPEVSKSQQAEKPKPARRSTKSKPKATKSPPVIARQNAEERVTARVVKFPDPPTDVEDESNPEVEEIKNQVRQAMRALEEGKQVAALNLLKRIIHD
jgi:hypothetical protein